MDWLRRNWPDLLIGIALLAVIAGIVATLLTGGSFFPLNSGQPSTPLSTPGVSSPGVSPSASSPDASSPNASSPNAESPSVGTPDASSPDAAAPNASNVAPDGGADAPSSPAVPGAATPGSAAPGSTPQAGEGAVGTPGTPGSATPGAIAILPPADGAAGASPNAGAAAGNDAQASAAAPANAGAAGAPADAGAAAESPPSSSQLPTAPYRVSVGAFSTESNAQRQADAFREAGFPVFIGRQGDLVLVLVGPYESEQEAQQAVTQIRSGDFGIEPVVYRFQPDGEQAAATQQSQPEPAPVQEEAASQPAAEVEAAPSPAPAASGDGMFLQVGAYATRESALPQIARLQEMGFAVEERTESGLVKLMVGPFEGDALASARQQLNDEGIEHFAR